MTPGHPPAALLLAEEVWGSTLHAMRSLAGRGADVLVAVAGEGASIYRSSKACTHALDIPTGDPAQFCETAREWAAAVLGFDRPVVVIPLSDRLTDHLNQHRCIFTEQFRLALAEPPVIESLLDKRTAFAAAETAGLTVPQWEAIGHDGAHEYAVEAGAPVAVRPARWTAPGPDYFKVVVTADQGTIDRLIADSESRGVPLVAQRYVDAPDEAVEFGIVWRSADGASTAVCTGRKRRQSAPGGGVMVWGEAMELPDVLDAATAFLDESGFTGLGGIEFIRAGGALNFIEFNPRLEAIHFLATAAGVDTLAMAYEEFAGSVPPALPSRQHQAAAWMGSAWMERLRMDSTYRWRAVADRWAFSRLPVKTRAIWSWDDAQPGLRVSFRLGGKLLSSVSVRVRDRLGVR